MNYLLVTFSYAKQTLLGFFDASVFWLIYWQVVDALELSQATMSKVYQNLSWAIAYNVVAVPIAAGVLLPQYDFAMTPSLSGPQNSVTQIYFLLLEWWRNHVPCSCCKICLCLDKFEHHGLLHAAYLNFSFFLSMWMKESVFYHSDVWFDRWADGSELNICCLQLVASTAPWVSQKQKDLALNQMPTIPIIWKFRLGFFFFSLVRMN